MSSALLLALLQAVADPSAAAAVPAPPAKACYVKRIVQKDQPAFDFQVIVPIGKQALATEAGYAPVACSSDARKLRSFRAKMCEAAELDDAVNARTVELFGVDPRKMCAAAKELKDDDAG